MPTSIYRTSDGKRVPGTTTIISRFKESGGLIHWAWQCGVDGINYRDARDAAASAGTVGHELIDAHIHGREPVLEPGLPDAVVSLGQAAFDAYREWEDVSKVRITKTEMALVSDEYRFGGTPDAVGYVGERFALLDWKTSNRIYMDYLLQLAAYCHLWECNGGEEITRVYLLRLGKEDGSFHYHSWPREALAPAWEQFKDFRACYERDKALKRMAG